MLHTAPLPPMGWNSRDCHGTTEAEVPANAQLMANRLPPFGWDVVVDEQGYEPMAPAGGYNDDAPVVLDAFGLDHTYPPTQTYDALLELFAGWGLTPSLSPGRRARVSDVLAHDTAPPTLGRPAELTPSR